MSTVKFRKRTVATLLVSILGLSACVVVPAHPYEGGGAYVSIAPPAPQVEVYGAAPGPGFFWVGGYWNWVGGRYAWVGGHWEHHRAGYNWVAHRWVHEGGGWRMEPGHWARR